MLTSRQAQILAKVAMGKTNKEIGRDLGISTNTVKNTLCHSQSGFINVEGLVGSHSRTALAIWAILGRIPTEEEALQLIKVH